MLTSSGMVKPRNSWIYWTYVRNFLLLKIKLKPKVRFACVPLLGQWAKELAEPPKGVVMTSRNCSDKLWPGIPWPHLAWTGSRRHTSPGPDLAATPTSVRRRSSPSSRRLDQVVGV
jgi:hypothetical protein